MKLAENSVKQINPEKASYLKLPYPWSWRIADAEVRRKHSIRTDGLELHLTAG